METFIENISKPGIYWRDLLCASARVPEEPLGAVGEMGISLSREMLYPFPRDVSLEVSIAPLPLGCRKIGIKPSKAALLGLSLDGAWSTLGCWKVIFRVLPAQPSL